MKLNTLRIPHLAYVLEVSASLISLYYIFVTYLTSILNFILIKDENLRYDILVRLMYIMRNIFRHLRTL